MKQKLGQYLTGRLSDKFQNNPVTAATKYNPACLQEVVNAPLLSYSMAVGTCIGTCFGTTRLHRRGI